MLSTAQKVFIATLLSTTVRKLRDFCGLSSFVRVRRYGLFWELNLKEGIDLSIYLLGGFELSTRHYYQKRLQPGAVIIDIGANIGAHTLPFADVVGEYGRVIAFEPTEFAFQKLCINLSLNPHLLARVTPIQAMLVESSILTVPPKIHSSWPVDGSKDVDSTLCGRLMSTSGSIADTLDEELKKLSISHVDLIKIDVDGYELGVLRGAQNTIRTYSPIILMELAPYTYSNATDFDDVLKLLWSYGYTLENINSGEKLPCDVMGVKKIIPKNGGINVWAYCQKS
jgi:FkbM family methyltransferase